MANYPLHDLAEFTECDGERIGMLIRCPNCGVAGGVMFSGTKYLEKYPGTSWVKTGSALESISLNPSVAMQGHFHSWVRDGMLCVDSPFKCKGNAVSDYVKEETPMAKPVILEKFNDFTHWLHHANKPSELVHSKAEADALGAGWFRSPNEAKEYAERAQQAKNELRPVAPIDVKRKSGRA